ncbi:hypothetical protein M758_11G062700 [Ceratodon purpureus]|nr:hypothetical protein M758_11G062700 [Ceratodon purpureus]
MAVQGMALRTGIACELPVFQGLRGATRASQSFSIASCSPSSRRLSYSGVCAAALKPLGDRVLVKVHKTEEKSAGGILLPSSAQTKPQGGEVVAVGEGRKVGEKTVAPAVAAGAKIVYAKYAGSEVPVEGEQHVLLKEDDVVGMLESDDIKDLQPAGDRVLLRVMETEGKTAGGVLLTESAKEKPVIGTVEAAGPGALGEDGERVALPVKKGDTVLYSKYGGSEFKSKDGAVFVVLRVQDILAVLS